MRSHVMHWLESFTSHDVADALAPSWFTCVGFAGLVTLLLMLAMSRRRGIDPGTVASAVLWCYVAAVVAGIVVPMVIDSIEYLLTTGHFRLRWAGMTSFWGYLAGFGAAALVCRRDRVALGRMADLSVIPIGFALVCARLGCFMAGCDYGKVSSVPWAVRFPSGSPAWRDHLQAGLIPANRTESLAVHPTQLYEALLGIVIVVVAIVVARRMRRDGQLFLVGAATYAIGRLFVIEPLRGDLGRGIYAGLSSGQIFSLLLLLAIAAIFVIPRRRRIVTAMAAAATVLAIGNVGEAEAQPSEPPPVLGPQLPDQQPEPIVPPDRGPPGSHPDPSQMPPETFPPPPPDEPLLPVDPMAQQQPPPPPTVYRPKFHVGALFGMASALNRRAEQVPTLAGPSLSLGWTPGYFGMWLDYDSYTNDDALHATLLASVSYMRKPNARLSLGVRAGIGLTRVNFKDPAFRDVSGKTVRIDAVVDYGLAYNWSLWVRPLSIDVLDAAELGGPITTAQFRIGFAYRWGARRPAPAPLPPVEPPQPPPQPYPTLDPTTAPAMEAP